MTDVFQQAREALDPKWTRPMQETVSLMHSALLAVVKAADAGHLIDTRRLRAAMVSVAPCDNGLWDWESAGRWEGEYATAADALAAAERETSRGKTPDLMAALKASLGIPDTPERETGL